MAKTLAVVDEPSTAAGGLEHLKSAPERLTSFLHDVRSEMRKVITPTRAEVQMNTTVVVVTVFLFAGYFWVVDTIFGQVIERVLGTLSKH